MWFWNNWVLNSRGVAYDIKGDPDKAITDFDAAIRIKADYGEAYINRGLAWVKKGTTIARSSTSPRQLR
jgi:tetratricopeptide (TPR) repeat protein